MAAVAQLYARAFADVVQSDSLKSDEAMAQLQLFENAFTTSHDLRELMSNPAVPLEQKLKVLDSLCARIRAAKQVRNFLAVLLQRDRMAELTDILHETRIELDRRSGIVEAQVVSARELDAAQRSAFETTIAKMLNSQRIRATYGLNPDLLGGATVQVGSTIFDGSVQGRLERLKQQLASN